MTGEIELKKVGIITLHRVRNYGSVLQTYALCETLKKYGVEPIVIDYIPKRFRLRTDLFYVRKDRYTDRNGRENKLKKHILSVASIFPRYYYYTRFSQFVNKYIKLSEKQYFSYNDLKMDTNLNYDIYMNGSDQVWNMAWENGVDPTFFLDFTPFGKKRYAYAASFSKPQLSQDEFYAIMPLLQKYQYISVREKSGIDILKAMGIKNAEFVLDPTFLLTKQQWSNIASKRLIKEPYVLIYQLNADLNLVPLAKNIAMKRKLKVVDFSRSLKAKDGVDYVLGFKTPQDFLSAAMYADYIVTDSFHGTAFSINFNKEFLSIRYSYPERVKSLLELVELNDRFVDKDCDNEPNGLQLINYTEINSKIEVMRKVSFDFLEKIVKQ